MDDIGTDERAPGGGTFHASCVRDRDALVLRLAGDLDVATWEQPVETLDAALPTDADGLVVDLADVTFVDSSGLGCLVRLRTVAHQHDLPLTLRSPRPGLVRLLRLSGLESVFDVKPVSRP